MMVKERFERYGVLHLLPVSGAICLQLLWLRPVAGNGFDGNSVPFLVTVVVKHSSPSVLDGYRDDFDKFALIQFEILVSSGYFGFAEPFSVLFAVFV